MGDDLRVGCPQCGTIYRLKGRQTVGRKVTCRNCGDAFVARLAADDLEPELGGENSSGDGLPPPVHTSGKPRGSRRLQKRLKIDRRIVVVVVVVLVVGLGFAFIGPLVEFAKNTKRLARTGRLSDSPDAVYTELASVLHDVRNLADTIRDHGSRTAAIQKFKDMKPRFADLMVRACLLKPIPEDEFKAVYARHKDSLQWEREDAKQVSQRVSDAGQMGVDLLAAVAELAREFQDTAEVLRQSLIQPMEPQNAADRFEFNALQIKRRLVRRIATVSSFEDMNAAAADAGTSAKSIEELASQCSAAEAGAVVSSGKYAGYRAATNFLLERIRHVMETRYGTSNDLRQGLVALQSAEDIVVNPLPKGWTRKIFTNPVPPAAAEKRPAGPNKEGFGLE
jgi:hypothetical protein